MSKPKPKLEKGPADIFLEQAIKDGAAVKQLMSIAKLTIDQDLQSRTQNSVEHEMHLASQLDDGHELAAIVVFRDSVADANWVADGFHRSGAYIARSRIAIPAYVIEGTRDDAILFSVSANLWQGKATGKEDRKKAAFMMFGNEQHRMLSDCEIARRCGIGPTTAKKYRTEHNSKTGTPIPDLVTGSNGRVTPYRININEETGNRVSVRPYRGKFRAQGSQRQFYGKTQEEVEEKLREAGEFVLKQRRSLDLIAIASFLGVRSFHFEASRCGWSNYPGLAGRHGNGVVFVSTDFSGSSDVIVALGRLGILDAIHGPGLRKVVVCYPEDGPQTIIDLMRKHGVEFLTPDELVASLKGGESRESA